MEVNFVQYYEPLYYMVFNNMKNGHLIILRLLNLKFPVEYEELNVLKKIFNNASKKYIRKFFDMIEMFESNQYSVYDYHDYFFFEYLDSKKDIKYNINMINHIILNFNDFASEIEKNNLEKLEIAKKIRDLYREDLVLDGSLSFLRFRKFLKKCKDIDFFSFEQKEPMVKGNVISGNQKIEYEIFSENYVLYRDFNKDILGLEYWEGFKVLDIKSLYNKVFKFKVFNRSYFINYLILSELLGEDKKKFIRKIEEDRLEVRNASNLDIIPVPFNFNFTKYLTTYFKEDNLGLFIKYYFLYKIFYNEIPSNIIFLIYYVVRDIELSQKIYEEFSRLVFDYSYFRTSKSIVDRYLMLIFFLNIYRDKINLSGQSLENKLHILCHFRTILERSVMDYKKNSVTYRKRKKSSSYIF